jgi:diadenosine tetraphosphate (Ap4A) HIT family hydrolase
MEQYRDNYPDLISINNIGFGIVNLFPKFYESEINSNRKVPNPDEVLFMSRLICPFCSPEEKDIVFKNSLWYARWDDYPASQGHFLIIPFRHCEDYFVLTDDERKTLSEMIIQAKEVLDEKFSPGGYNIVTNVGEAAEQTVMHCHIHVIPRYHEEPDSPPGGIKKIVFNEKKF